MIFSPSFCARFDSRQQFVHFRPVLLAGGFDVINLRRNVRFAADPQQFVERFEQLIPFAAHVRDVFALIFRGDLAQLDQLFGFRIKRRRINQRSADPERARFHFLAHELAHLVELLRRRLLCLRSR